jgi:hypothetical protein
VTSRIQSATLLSLFAVCLTGLTGCGGNAGSEVRKQATSHVRLLTSLHTKISSELGRYPKDEAEFKAALAKANLSNEALKVNNLDELFVSERDGQPLVVVYGQAPAGSDIVVYEQTGANGLRQVGHRIGMIEEVDAARFAEIVPSSGK